MELYCCIVPGVPDLLLQHDRTPEQHRLLSAMWDRLMQPPLLLLCCCNAYLTRIHVSEGRLLHCCSNAQSKAQNQYCLHKAGMYRRSKTGGEDKDEDSIDHAFTQHIDRALGSPTSPSPLLPSPGLLCIFRSISFETQGASGLALIEAVPGIILNGVVETHRRLEGRKQNELAAGSATRAKTVTS